ncbi:MAG: hypothetical protein R3E79_28895 [Caldilineaceae bacterium]
MELENGKARLYTSGAVGETPPRFCAESDFRQPGRARLTLARAPHQPTAQEGRYGIFQPDRPILRDPPRRPRGGMQ